LALKQGKNISDIIGGYGKPINPYKLTQEEQQTLVNEQGSSTTPPISPVSPQYRPSTPPMRGGSRKISKVSAKKTRKFSSKKTLYHVAKAFSRVWGTVKH
jgi:hypothetical protein